MAPTRTATACSRPARRSRRESLPKSTSAAFASCSSIVPASDWVIAARARRARSIGVSIDSTTASSSFWVGIVLGDLIAELGKRRRMELWQRDLQRQMCRGQIPKLLEQIIQRSIRESPKLAHCPSTARSQESASKTLLRRAALHTTAALRLTTRAARTALVAPNLRHTQIMTRPPVGNPPQCYHSNLRTGLLSPR